VTVRVVRPGLLATVQDLGRAGGQRHGIPIGGAMDTFALRVANLLVGNAEGDAALEVTLAGPTLAFEREALLAIGGADLGAAADGVPLPRWHPVRVPAGACVSLGAARDGCRAYVAIAGGVDVPAVLGSRSTFARARIGGLDGRALRAGDAFPVGAPSPLAARIAAALGPERAEPRAMVAHWGAGASLLPRYSARPVVRLVPGAHLGALTARAREALTGEEFRVAPASDRMGYRLQGPALALSAPLELLSEGVAFGTVQLPPGGSPIVLMADRQTTGGYPRLGEVASVDLPLLAQLRPGDRLRFRAISLEEAQALYLAREQAIAELRVAIALRHR
jgi:antagonist of KipI